MQYRSPRDRYFTLNGTLQTEHSLFHTSSKQISWRCPPRVEQSELLDLGHGSDQEVRQNLTEMWQINRFLGGFRALTTHLYPRLAAQQTPITLVDLGTGSADIPVAIACWARQRGLAIQILAVDWSARNLAAASFRINGTTEVRLLYADACSLPLRPGSVDYVISTLFLHHFSPDHLIELLRSAYAWARRGLIMSDLVRGWLPLAGFKLVQPIFARTHLTRHDGALSIRRAYTPDELRALSDAAGLAHANITTHWPWRMTLVAEK